MDFLAHEQVNVRFSQKCKPHLSTKLHFFYKKCNLNVANLEKKQYLCTVEYFVADILGVKHYHGQNIN